MDNKPRQSMVDLTVDILAVLISEYPEWTVRKSLMDIHAKGTSDFQMRNTLFKMEESGIIEKSTMYHFWGIRLTKLGATMLIKGHSHA